MTAQHTAQPQGQEVPIIPARRNGVTMLCVNSFLAIMAGLVLRLVFVYRFPATAGDSEIYLQLARNWADRHIYGLWLNGHLVPTDLRMPGYPAFLAVVAMILGRSIQVISLSQILIDLGTCCLTAALCAALAPIRVRHRAWIAGLWIAATCPFIANYTAVVLTEVFVTFLVTGALLCFVLGLRPKSPSVTFHSNSSLSNNSSVTLAAAGAFLTGIATLVRPEMPLLLIVAVFVYTVRWWSRFRVRRIALFGAIMAGAFVLPLLPWAARNLVTLHEVQMLAPRYATLPSEYAPVGYYAWTRTWLERYRDVYLSVWVISEQPLEMENFPDTAFDSPRQKERIAALVEKYNTSENLDISPDLDNEFAEIARERTAQHPLRTYAQVPFERALTIWFTPRTELLPIDGKIWPLPSQWHDSHEDVLLTAGFGLLGYLYILLGMGGIVVAWRAARRNRSSKALDWDMGNYAWGIALLLLYLLIRTVFLTTVEAPEPRYVVSCYPAVLALAALFVVSNKNIEDRNEREE